MNFWIFILPTLIIAWFHFPFGVSQTEKWNWSINQSQCTNATSLVHMRFNRSELSVAVTCVYINPEDYKLPDNYCSDLPIVASHHDGDIGGMTIHLVCSCKDVALDCIHKKLYQFGDYSIFCMTGQENVTVCKQEEICSGPRAGCIPKASCKKSADSCLDSESDCCCESSFCNGWLEKNAATTPHVDPPKVHQSLILVVVIVAVIVFSLICLTMWLLYRFRKKIQKHPPVNQFRQQHDQNDLPLLTSERRAEEEPPSREMPPPLQFASVKLMDMLSRGQRGTRSVYTANCDGTVLAVKYFALNDFASWDAELKIYSLPHMNHENLLKFIGYTIGGMNAECSPSDHAIFTEYMPLGSLQDVLKDREVDWDTLLHIASGMMCGLAYLHSAIPSSDPNNAKPPIAHRDFKSRNVLLKEDMTACVADFGLALPFDSARRTSNCGQVGTLRYMAPEVLDLAVNFSCDAFLRIDVYACGLTLWEILRRCNKPPELKASPVYEQPFETQLNKVYPACHNHPTLSEMQDVVFMRRLRPDLPEVETASHNVFDLIVTIGQCWDHDSEARPSAGCVYNRIKRIREQSAKSTTAANGVSEPKSQAANGVHANNSNHVQTNGGAELSPISPTVAPRC